MVLPSSWLRAIDRPSWSVQSLHGRREVDPFPPAIPAARRGHLFGSPQLFSILVTIIGGVKSEAVKRSMPIGDLHPHVPIRYARGEEVAGEAGEWRPRWKDRTGNIYPPLESFASRDWNQISRLVRVS